MNDVYSRASNWLGSLKKDIGFGLTAGKEGNLLAICYMTLMLEGLGRIEGTGREDEMVGVAYLQHCQDDESGLFGDPGSNTPAIESGGNGTCLESLQRTYFALHALDALGLIAPYRLHFMDAYAARDALDKWLESLDWSRGFLEGSRLMFILSFLIYRAEVEQNRAATELFHRVLDWLDKTQDAKTGLWGTEQQISAHAAIGIGCCLIPFYQYVHRPIRRVARIVDTALGLRASPDSFVGYVGGSEWEDLAAVDLLATFTRQVSYRKDDIRRALMQSYLSIKSMQNQDGSFPYTQGETAESYQPGNCGGIEAMSICSPVWASWLRLLTLATVEHTYPDDIAHSESWVFRRWPCIGYQQAAGTLSEHQREVLPLWLRPSLSTSLAEEHGSKPPPISVVIPCYNLGRYLHEAVESVFAQTMQDFELIIVNDGSTDEFTRLLLAGFDRPKTQVIHQGNQGLPAARNNGIRLAKGGYICCLDPDDRLRPQFFEKAFRILEAKPDIGLVTGHFEMFDE